MLPVLDIGIAKFQNIPIPSSIAESEKHSEQVD